jgi:hypothetical protein
VGPIGFWSTVTSRDSAFSPSPSTPATTPAPSSASASSSTTSTTSAVVPTTSASTCVTSVDLPEPETPVTAVNTPRGKLASRSSPSSAVRRIPAARAKGRCRSDLPAHPRTDFKNCILRAFYEGMVDRPQTTFGTMNADVLAHFDPNFQRIDMVDLIKNSPWPE